ncbi:MAG: hypothetical protein MZU97_21420 [Bacillus subtilis]|nr:hypothetical protein [Bacillus subtilis]
MRSKWFKPRTVNGSDWLDQVIAYVHANYLYLKHAIETTMPRIHLFAMEGTYLCMARYAADSD